MGVDCRIRLPHPTRISDVATVLSALLGYPMTKEPLGKGASYHALCDGVFAKPSTLPNCATLAWFGAPLRRLSGSGRDGRDDCGSVLYHFETREGRLLMPRSTPFWIAGGRRLVSFFGGVVDYADCDDIEANYTAEERSDIHAEDGAEWHALQDRLLAVTPLTLDEIANHRQDAAYEESYALREARQ